MTDERPRRSLDSLKKEAKRWLDALRANVADARARLARAIPTAPAKPTLRDVQHALAREHGFPGWAALKRALEQTVASSRETGAKALAHYQAAADALLDAYRTGTPEAMERHYRYTWHRRAWRGMRTYVQLDLGKRPTGPADDVDITLDDAKHLVAIEHGFANWDALRSFTESPAASARVAAKPVRLVHPDGFDEWRTIAGTREWDAAIRLLAVHPSAVLNAEGQMTDEVLADVAAVDTITGLNLGGSKGVTDDGVRHLAGLPALKHLDLSGTAITDRGLAVLRELPALETLSLAGTRITDEGATHLAHCHELRQINLSWTRMGDGALRALAGKQKLAVLASGSHVTDEGIRLLHELPVFKTWHGGEVRMALLSYSTLPNQLWLRGRFTDRGMQHMPGLDGLFGSTWTTPVFRSQRRRSSRSSPCRTSAGWPWTRRTIGCRTSPRCRDYGFSVRRTMPQAMTGSWP
jgi:hypothetical protein